MSDKNVLVVDDEPITRKCVIKILEAQGHHCVEASSLKETYDLLEQKVPDLLLLDLNLEGETTEELLGKRQNDLILKNVPTIMLSATQDPKIIKKMYKYGIEDFITKPVVNHVIAQKIKKAFHKTRDVYRYFFSKDNPLNLEIRIPAKIEKIVSDGILIKSKTRLATNTVLRFENEALKEKFDQTKWCTTRTRSLAASNVNYLTFAFFEGEEASENMNLFEGLKKENNKVYLLDDDQNCINFAEMIFNKNEFEFFGTTSPKKYIDKLKEDPPIFSIIDLNLEMGKGAGFQLVQAIRSILGPLIPIFILSGRDNSFDIAKGIQLGANDYFVKPLVFKTFIERVKNKINDIEIIRSLKDMDPVEEDKNSGTLIIKEQAIEVCNKYLLFFSSSLYVKGTELDLSGEFVQEISKRYETLRVCVEDCSFVEEKNKFYCKCVWIVEDEDFKENLKIWISKLKSS